MWLELFCLGLACFGLRVVVFLWDNVPGSLECILFWCSMKEFYSSKKNIYIKVGETSLNFSKLSSLLQSPFQSSKTLNFLQSQPYC
jgi:hypothetical protein